MATLRIVLIGAEIICGLLLIGLVLMQKSKEQGLGMAFGSGVGDNLFGAQTTTVLMKATIVLAIVFFLNTMVLARLYSARDDKLSSVTDLEETSSSPETKAQPKPQPQPTGPGPVSQ